jgi:drug/metabolite transporter (DMT)-like permease
VVSIEFTMPIWSAALAVVFLGERMNARKWLAIVLGLVGVALILAGNVLNLVRWPLGGGWSRRRA